MSATSRRTDRSRGDDDDFSPRLVQDLEERLRGSIQIALSLAERMQLATVARAALEVIRLIVTASRLAHARVGGEAKTIIGQMWSTISVVDPNGSQSVETARCKRHGYTSQWTTQWDSYSSVEDLFPELRLGDP